ncbi:unannotated protein [freshwater metagenome]|uniref:Unannotated protein n=1 Tax=freshwater metagenome TaxID=449393 RepID=A0A6J6FNG4_9ZZZZ|nr:hypothetical protein [Actinomycetota bacterium]MSW99031.1 hypothetical protein [Actinomycetota bacterium]MSZ45834.1 hypothetical protein [Actinomycetota bacterium]MTA04974.1 hypothetical protein [Actinomycetota bacterium]MTA22486.1 hypothetical protein [Actinomycetota bacterium]
MKLDIKRVFPRDPAKFEGLRGIRLVTALFIVLVVVRSCIHLFASDGGAHSIAGVDTSVEGGENIIAMFHQWGAIQLLLALLLVVLFFRYPGLTPLILLSLAMDPVLRFVSGQIQHLTTVGTPPGETFNSAALYLLLALFIASLAKK